jgi:hypothetical protein
LIGEPLAFHALQKTLCAVLIVYAKRDAVVIAEVEFSKVAVQVIVSAVLIDALHAALEDRKETFDGIGVDTAVGKLNVFPETVTRNGSRSGRCDIAPLRQS